jgi:hypothetical protein
VGTEWGSIGVEGHLDPRNSYEFDLRYADPESEALVRYSDDVVTRDVYLTSGRSRHTLRVHIFPSRIDGGHFTLSILTYNGSVDIFASALREVGPNGTFFALKQASARNEATIGGLHWSMLGGADFNLKSCVHCLVEAAVNGGGFWDVAPAGAVAERTIGMAHAGESLRALSPGIAGWLLSLPKEAHVSLRYEPRSRFHFGLVLSLAGVALVLALLTAGLRSHKPAHADAATDILPSTIAQRITALLIVCCAPFIHVVSNEAGTILGTLILIAALALAASFLVRFRRVKRGITNLDVSGRFS